MLIESPLTKNDIICIKTSNGDEIIAKLIDQDLSFVNVSKPMLMVLAQDPRTGQPGVQMVPFWMIGGDREGRYPIAKAHITCMVKANSDATNGYLSNTTGLAMANNSSSIITGS